MAQSAILMSSKGRRFLALGGELIEILEGAGLSEVELERLANRGSELRQRLGEIVRELSANDVYEREEVPSNVGYAFRYDVRPLREQIALLRGIFPGLGGHDHRHTFPDRLSSGMEGYFAIPQWRMIGSTYDMAVNIVLSALRKRRFTTNSLSERMGASYLRERARSVDFWKNVSEYQNGADILIVQAQFGRRHVGRSPRRVCEVYDRDEFGLGTFATGIMLLTHPERLGRSEDMWVNCVGDEFRFETIGGFTHTPIWSSTNTRIELNAGDSADYEPCRGSATAVHVPFIRA